MTTDLEEQEEEMLALQSIFDPEEFVRNEPKSAGKIRVSVELPAAFTVSLREGETLRQYEISFLPPLLLTFELPENYPSSSPPSFTLTCSWLTHTQLSALTAHLIDLYQTTGGAVVLFSWVQFLREDALRFLNIDSRLELPSDEHNTRNSSQDTQSCNVSAPSSEADPGNADSQGALASDSCKNDQDNITSSHSKLSKNDVNSEPNRDNQNTLPLQTKVQNMSNDFDQIAQSSDVCKPGHIFQTPEFRDDHHNDLSSEAEEAYPTEPLPDKTQSPSSLSLTPAQALQSQLLIYDAAQKQKVFASTFFDCGVCFMGCPGSQCVQLMECGHVYCKACLANFCEVQIKEGNIQGVTCPQADCTATPAPAEIKSLVGEELFSRYDRLLLQLTLDSMPDVVYCPRRTCGSAVILEKGSNVAICSLCNFVFCVTCKKTYIGTGVCCKKKKQTVKDSLQAHVDLPQSKEGLMALWDDYVSGSKQRQHLLESRYGGNTLNVTVEGCLTENWLVLNSKNCPYCFCRIQKDRGCNRMICSQCNRLFCWGCLAKVKPCSNHFRDCTA
ncbi:E3 ubiquitin-protein ligase RNF14-like [Scomber scombrus]|uniref:RBR-type E3 ubiquitin transferase n=1 Tax=Scomber scombrus TaxID=13677 RepID=A0AAV1PPE2_SCOSC